MILGIIKRSQGEMQKSLDFFCNPPPLPKLARKLEWIFSSFHNIICSVIFSDAGAGAGTWGGGHLLDW